MPSKRPETTWLIGNRPVSNASAEPGGAEVVVSLFAVLARLSAPFHRPA
jgi:hypothetical protein